jgi:hypothetical protein
MPMADGGETVTARNLKELARALLRFYWPILQVGWSPPAPPSMTLLAQTDLTDFLCEMVQSCYRET